MSLRAPCQTVRARPPAVARAVPLQRARAEVTLRSVSGEGSRVSVEAIVRRDRALVGAGLAGITLLAWLYLTGASAWAAAGCSWRSCSSPAS